MDYNTVIIGSGVAGMTAAIYLSRVKMSVCVIERDAPGGQVLRTDKIDNYPGFVSITGADLASNIYNQVSQLNVDYKFTEVTEIKIESDKKIVKTNNGEITCQNIIIATGRSPKWLNATGEENLVGKGISFCATCDGNLYKDKNVAVVGGGVAALEEALYLSKICNHVTLIHRRSTFSAHDSLVEEVKSCGNVDILTNRVVENFISSDGKLSAIKVRSKDDQIEEIEVEACFENIGQKPNTEMLSSLDILDEDNYVIVDSNYETKYKGMYAIGDCLKKDLYQIITAEAEGAKVASRIIKTR